MSYARVVVYTFHPGKADEVIAKAKAGLGSMLKGMQGFQSYNVVKMNDDSAISISVFTTREQTEAAVQQMAGWVKETIAHLVVSAPTHVGEYISMV
ncbi:MAG: hypothetical protein NVS2B16_36890 [Chloroflexota bacterium]